MSENFEKQVKYILDEVQLEPHTEVWQNVKKHIQPQKRNRRFISWWLLPVALVAGGLVYFLNNNNSKNEQVAETKITHSSSGLNVINSDGQEFIDNENEAEKKKTEKAKGAIASSVVISQTPKRSKHIIWLTKQVNQVISSSAQVTSQSPSSAVNKIEQKITDDAKSYINSNPQIITDQTAPLPIAGNAKPVAKEDIRNKDSIVGNDTVKTVAGVEKPSLKRSKWSFGVTADIGVATATGSMFGDKKTEGPPVFTSIPTSPASGASASITYQRVTASARPSYGLYVTANRKINNALSLQSSLGFRQQSFSILASTVKDSLMQGGYVSIPVIRSGYFYRLNYLNLYTGASLGLLKLNELKLNFGAGIENQLLIAAQSKRNQSLFSNNNFTLDKNMLLNSYKKWQPSLRLSLAVDVNSDKKKWLQLSTYFNYGLREFEKDPATSKNHLASFGLSATYFFR